MDLLLLAAFLGIIEGLTEFLPVSSTGHLVLLVDLLGFPAPSGKTFEVVIQLGAILAVCVAFFPRLWQALTGVATVRSEQLFVRNILIAFLPAMVIGAGAYSMIRALLDSPMVVAVALVLGGIAILLIERLNHTPRYHAIEQFPLPLTVKIGLFQCIAMIPGVSRSGATIMGSLLMGVERKTAAEFSFFLAIPTMAGATAYSLYKNWAALDFSAFGMIGIGFVTAFITALLVVRVAIGFIGRHGFAPFAWYRIVLGLVMIGVLALR